MRQRWDSALGEVLVTLAVLTERATAGRRAVVRWRRLRDDALRAAHGRGVSVDVLAARLGLSRKWIHTVVTRPANGQDSAEVTS
ncbi:hypothetical protein J7I94_02585 [Streptomyces sp. ISL-12]|uniref:hypothetical protein n=1 Tax=Streptomyces sp. ISL-12 TaxID=2819177 RepID=UPI001BE99854|nr:hypothetical protein [Streptomyces sp. ISL-12]MBT2409458.1 hypothetical protein [Streptomyces sp. ISL-12]